MGIDDSAPGMHRTVDPLHQLAHRENRIGGAARTRRVGIAATVAGVGAATRIRGAVQIYAVEMKRIQAFYNAL